jgi:hypothetical protein
MYLGITKTKTNFLNFSNSLKANNSLIVKLKLKVNKSISLRVSR